MKHRTPTLRVDGKRWRRLRLAVLQRDRYRCACGAPASTVDHVIPLAEGGAPADPANLRARCERCNYRDGGRLGALRKNKRRIGSRSREW